MAKKTKPPQRRPRALTPPLPCPLPRPRPLGCTLTRVAEILDLSEAGARLVLGQAGVQPVGRLEERGGRLVPMYDPAVAARLALDRSYRPPRVAARAS